MSTRRRPAAFPPTPWPPPPPTQQWHQWHRQWHHQWHHHHQWRLQWHQHHAPWTSAPGPPKKDEYGHQATTTHQQQHQPNEHQLQQPNEHPLQPPGGDGVVLEEAASKSKEEEESLWSNVEAQAAFLGPNLWDRTLPYDTDLKYVDLDEFLSENGIPVEGGGGEAGVPPHQHSTEPPHLQTAAELQTPSARRPPSRSPRPESYDGGDEERQYPQGVKVEQQSSCRAGRLLRCSPQPPPVVVVPSDPDTVNSLISAAGPPSPAESDFSMSSSTTTTTGHDFDPRTRAFSDEELKPQPMIKKSKKQFVPDDLKDEKYWARRRKNNMAAKRSRDARRVKENQIALRAGFLEKENITLRQELERLKKENSLLRERLTKYTEDV
ncbi:hepatic leukemia factor-like isoform X2 [Ischnura elegans]|uniref:hepatic leukemia factor-like isoform X2 n=1 Tax=Ischnura elegans TaxID=197161 RepID=UPI001ED88A0B|nr:hepatic leukemia factor-like isoform X2 [Ischnura elegans]